jgi:hypothetical protein
MDSTSTSNSENCLFLNVFTQVGYARKHSGRSVIVWIYGGRLIAASPRIGRGVHARGSRPDARREGARRLLAIQASVARVHDGGRGVTIGSNTAVRTGSLGSSVYAVTKAAVATMVALGHFIGNRIYSGTSQLRAEMQALKVADA